MAIGAITFSIGFAALATLAMHGLGSLDAANALFVYAISGISALSAHLFLANPGRTRL